MIIKYKKNIYRYILLRVTFQPTNGNSKLFTQVRVATLQYCILNIMKIYKSIFEKKSDNSIGYKLNVSEEVISIRLIFRYELPTRCYLVIKIFKKRVEFTFFAVEITFKLLYPLLCPILIIKQTSIFNELIVD